MSNAQVDRWYEQARSAGAVGGKLTGAGGGGFLLLFVPPARRQAVLAALDPLMHVPFAFEASGTEILFSESGVDYQDAERARRPVLRVREQSLAV